MYSGFVADDDANIAVCGCHKRWYIDRKREHPALPKNLNNALQVHRRD